MSTSHEYDAIVVGGGHNGLTNGAYLAKAGLKTLVLERRHLVGGAAITEELYPGFGFTTFSYALSLLRPVIVHELELVKHGFNPIYMPTTFAPMENGDDLLLGADRDENLREIMRHSPRDADAMDRFDHDLTRVLQLLRPLFDRPPPNIFGKSPEDAQDIAWLLGHLGSAEPKVVHDAVRLITGSITDFLDDYFESEIIKGHLAAGSTTGTKVGPMSAGSGLVFLMMAMGEHDGNLGSWSFHKGGNGGFAQVLARAAQSYGAEIRLEAPVDHVLTRDGRAVGVVLTDGTEFHADIVVSSLDPRRTFTELVDPRELPNELVDSINRFQFNGTSAKVNFALDGPPLYPALGDRTDQYGGFISIGPSIEYLERAFDDAEVRLVQRAAVHRRMHPVVPGPGHGPARQARDVVLRAVRALPPEGQRLGLRARQVRRRRPSHSRVVLPGFSDLVLHREVVTPLDIERVTGLSEGNIFAGDFLLPQMYFFRPAPGWAQYRTPIDGYYQCGSGTHPGGCVMGAPARLASQAILKDRSRG